MASFEGRVEAVNGTGMRLADHDEWLNTSKFHPVSLPAQGALVRGETDAKGFIKSLETIAAAPPTRERTISRLAVLKAAASFVGLLSQTRQDVRSEHVLALADKWLAWVEQ